MNKLDMQTKNLVESKLNILKDIFPMCIKNEKIDFDLLRQELSNDILEYGKEKYQMTWPGKNEAIINCNKQITNTLRPLINKSKNFYSTKNLYIEGDNLEALKILQESYLNKIDCIYIDPPYNTGNDFIYNDNFEKSINEELIESGQMDEFGNRLVSNNQSNGRFHSDWLSMMYSRLKLARNILKNDGIIFISIDDNEQANLKKICDEIFGEDNFIDTIMVELSITSGMKVGAAKEGAITKNGEFIHIYAKSSEWRKLNRIPLYDYVPGFDTHFSAFMDDDGNLVDLASVLSNNEYLVKEFEKYGIPANKIGMKSLSDIYDKSEVIHDFIMKNIEKIAQPRSETPILPKDLVLECGKWTKYVSEKRDEPYFLSVDESGKIIRLIPMSGHCKLSDDFNPSFGRVVIRGDYWKGFWRDMVNVYKEGDTQYKNGKKPVRLIKQLLKWAIGDNKNALVMDFFSGSATTAHAVMQLNASDNGNRNYIMIQVPEKINDNNYSGYDTICDIGQSRIIKSIDQIGNSIYDPGFRVYKIDSSNMKDVFYKPSEISQTNLFDLMSNIKEDRNSEDLLTQVMLDLGLTLDLKIEEKNIIDNKVYYVAENALVACFDDKVNIDIIDEICKCNPLKVVFKDISFKTDKDKINLEERIKKLSPDTEISIL